MPLCIDKNEQGFLFLTETPVSECSSMVLLTVDEYKQSTLDIPASDVVMIFSWAFGAVVIIGWLPGFAIGVAKKLIRSI